MSIHNIADLVKMARDGGKNIADVVIQLKMEAEGVSRETLMGKNERESGCNAKGCGTGIKRKP